MEWQVTCATRDFNVSINSLPKPGPAAAPGKAAESEEPTLGARLWLRLPLQPSGEAGLLRGSVLGGVWRAEAPAREKAAPPDPAPLNEALREGL